MMPYPPDSRTSPETRTLQDLLALQGPRFIGQAYLTLLGRPPDPAGYRHYESLLRGGAPKIQLISELCSSSEGRNYGRRLGGLDEALADVCRAAAPRSVTVDWLLGLVDELFVDQACGLVAGRPDDVDLIAHTARRLREGTHRLTLLKELLALRSAGAGPHAVQGLEPALVTLGDTAAQRAPVLARLLETEDLAFVDTAYRTLLLRAPDVDGLNHYVSRIRAGHSKMYVLAALRRSPEGRRAGVAVAGLDWAILRYLAARIPVLGAMVAALTGVDRETPLERRLRALDNWMRRADRRRAEAADADDDAVVRYVDSLLDGMTSRRPGGPA